jgi:mycoredoxin
MEVPAMPLPTRVRRGKPTGGSTDRTWPEIVVYSGRWCLQSWWTKIYLHRHHVPFREVNIDVNQEAARKVMAIAGGNRSVPTLVIENHGAVVEPTNGELADILNID